MAEISEHDEKRLIRACVGGMTLHIAKIKLGIKFTANTADYHRVRRKIIKAKNEKASKASEFALFEPDFF